MSRDLRRATPVAQGQVDPYAEPEVAHAIDPNSHRIEFISYRAETIECTCGAIITTPPDVLFHDRHQPLVDAWSDHGLAARRDRQAARDQRLAAARAVRAAAAGA